MTESKGHLFFFLDDHGTTHEVYEVGPAIFRAPLSNVIDIDTGYRIGRFLSMKNHFEHYIEGELRKREVVPAREAL